MKAAHKKNESGHLARPVLEKLAENGNRVICEDFTKKRRSLAERPSKYGRKKNEASESHETVRTHGRAHRVVHLSAKELTQAQSRVVVWNVTDADFVGLELSCRDRDAESFIR